MSTRCTAMAEEPRLVSRERLHEVFLPYDASPASLSAAQMSSGASTSSPPPDSSIPTISRRRERTDGGLTRRTGSSRWSARTASRDDGVARRSGSSKRSTRTERTEGGSSKRTERTGGGSSKRSLKRVRRDEEPTRRRSPTSSSDWSPSPAPPSPPPPPPASAPTWCWDCRLRLARLVEQPARHLCLCLPCSAGGSRGCPMCYQLLFVEVCSETNGDRDAEDLRKLLLSQLRLVAAWHIDCTPEPIHVHQRSVDGSHRRSLPLVLVTHRHRCLDCSPPQRPAVWVATCCSTLLCPSCLEAGMQRRHGACRAPGALGLVRNATATFDAEDQSLYMYREVEFSVKARVGQELRPFPTYVLRFFLSLTDLHRRLLPARRKTVVFTKFRVDGHTPYCTVSAPSLLGISCA